MNIHKYSLRLLGSLAILVILTLTFVMSTIEVTAQNQFTTDIAERLRQQGVPVRQVTTTNRLPYEIEIALQSNSNDEHLSIDDKWFMMIARREATFAYRISTRLTSFKLTLYNAKNDVIYSDQTYLYPKDLNQQINPGQPKVDDQEAKEIISKQLQLGGLTLDKLDVIPDRASGSNGQILIIQVSTIDLETANRYLPNFLGSFFRILEIANKKYGTYLVLCHLKVSDSKGDIFLDYVRDVESGSAQWMSVPGLYDEWFPRPVRSNKVISTATLIATPDTYPAPLMLEKSTELYPSP
jgi:hypothetical protein